MMEIVKTVRLVVVPRAGVEPARPYGQRILSPQRLPFRHPGTCSENSMRSARQQIITQTGRLFGVR